jgi:DNA invertase Pin-like site-specific DNA recombinase
MSVCVALRKTAMQASDVAGLGGGGKIRPDHQERLAVVYVRQSTPQQVLDHQESTRLQYGLHVRACGLGWSSDRVLVIDDDQGKSGTSTVGRVGFQRLVSEVGLGHVGLILGIEMSRLARSCADWHQLLELCALFGTLIADSDGVYDPSYYNDRLLLGLKGTMSEAELHIMQQRLRQGLLAKARRGALAVPVPSGYVRHPGGEVTFDPDEQVQHVVRLIFRKFEELGTLHALLRYLVAQQVQVGVRVREGPTRGDVAWRRPNRLTLQNLLKNPIYAGAYAYGRRQVDHRRQQPGRPKTGRVVCAPEEWLALLRDQHPAYISWEQYEWNLARLQANRSVAASRGAVRGGPALLAGLVVCGQCGSRMNVRYRHSPHTYDCTRRAALYGEPLCQHFPGATLEAWVSAQVLAALAPAALDLSLTAAAHLERERADLRQLWEQRRERASYETARAARHYRAIEPENRLVARQLAHDWEEKLAAQAHVEEEYHRFVQRQPRGLSAHEQGAIRRLAADIPALWHAPTTTVPERKELLRQVVQRVVVTVQGLSERVLVRVEWVGGSQTAGEITRPITQVEHLSCYQRLCARVHALGADGLTPDAIADCLAAEGYRSPKMQAPFTRRGVRDLAQRLGLHLPSSRQQAPVPLGGDDWLVPALARTLGMPVGTLYGWIARGVVRAQPRSAGGGHDRWVIWADAGEVARLQQLHQLPLGTAAHGLWVGTDAAPMVSVTPSEYP